MKSLFSSKTLRRHSSRYSSVLLLLQRTPVVQWILPEAPLAGGAAASKIAQWTIATVAGLGAYDTVAGATNGGAVISQLSPSAGTYAVSAPADKALVFSYQATGPYVKPMSWSISGTLPAGLVHSNSTNRAVDSITGVPTQVGTFPIKVTSWSGANLTGSSVTQDFTITITGGAIQLDAPTINVQPTAPTIKKGKRATLRVQASSAASYQWYKGLSGNTSAPVSGATTANFKTPVLKKTTRYWVRVTNAAGTADSKTTIVKVK